MKYGIAFDFVEVRVNCFADLILSVVSQSLSSAERFCRAWTYHAVKSVHHVCSENIVKIWIKTWASHATYDARYLPFSSPVFPINVFSSPFSSPTYKPTCDQRCSPRQMLRSIPSSKFSQASSISGVGLPTYCGSAELISRNKLPFSSYLRPPVNLR
jgi:hypothetical protein